LSFHTFSKNKFKVGDVVIIHSSGKSNGKKGFIEEIVRDKRDNLGTAFGALYSIYGFEQVKLYASDPASVGDFYFGDHLESELEWTGEIMTVEALREYRKKLTGGFANDIDIVIVNLGREEGRNKLI